MENQTKTKEPGKDAVLAKLERMLESMSENSKQPILELIHKRKVELGLLKSELPPAGYKLKKSKAHVKKQQPKNSIRKIAMNVGRVSETKETAHRDIDVKDEPLKKDKKPIEEVDSYKY